MTSYINAELDLYVDVSTTDKDIELGNFKYVFSDTLNEDFKNPSGCRALAGYEDDKRMHAKYILDDFTIKKKYFIFYRSVDNHFPLFISYYCIVHGYKEKKNSNMSSSSTFSVIIIIIIVFIVLAGICYCFREMCKSRSSSTYTPSYRAFIFYVKFWE